MSNNPKITALIYLHISVFLWGFTAIFGKLISYDSFTLVWHRMTLTAAVYFLFPNVWKQLFRLKKTEILRFLGIGAIVCAHWLTFYGSIKVGNSVSITLACLGSSSFFASIFEPVLLKQAFQKRDIISGLIVILGVAFISFSLPEPPDSNSSYTPAIVIGIVSAALAALFSALNKKYIDNAPPLTISALEMLSGAFLLGIVALILFPESLSIIPNWDISSFDPNNLQNGAIDLVWLILLSVLCTNLTFYLATIALKQISAFTANLSVNLEPVYGIILGIWVFKENQDLNTAFYLGTLIILAAIFVNVFVKEKVLDDAG